MKTMTRRHALHALGTTGALCLYHGAYAQWPATGAQPAADTNEASDSSGGKSTLAQKYGGQRQSGWGHFRRSGCTFAGAHLGAGPGGVPPISVNSGREDVDTAYQNEGLKLTKLFNVKPAGAFMNDSGSPNAFATADRFFTNSYDGTIILGVSLIGKELQRDRGQGISVPAIMAHEFSHIYQFKEGSLREVSTPIRELQADFLAGWYMAKVGLNDIQMRPAMEAFFGMGDFNFHSSQHHGTPQERLDALVNGFECDANDIDRAFNDGKSYLGV